MVRNYERKICSFNIYSTDIKTRNFDISMIYIYIYIYTQFNFFLNRNLVQLVKSSKTSIGHTSCYLVPKRF